ncbi:ParB/RepB/Spo0J family partition protein [Acutalibacter muris]|uniref:ParB/RepB/Spo0J family partition protein n=1 Tax=Acutalibacter muris TaxID=1796620 RepID=A0A1Z2XW00_9FIRM|nr:ParB/RepB/Spo0J family partition protein [Acutalibacter muris]ANU54154.1 stage 0 sporulation protein J [Hungateiclostridiaceae bacterium KB18]ASB42625.1 stage 0 sporulation protein J [Acutalibacter muris]QQR31922.1 ParB/RepB/Spo0J family partition protein [Acutalibacter muris]
MSAKKRGLGRGLDAIFAENSSLEGEGTVTVRIDDIEPNRDQPRKEFNSAALAELAESIAQHGVLQPLLLRPMVSGGYRIVAGERRWRASRMAGLQEVPAVVREMTDGEEMLFALIENLQREDLNPLEEAKGYQQLIDVQGMTQEEAAAAVGKSRPAVANALRLLNLPEDIQAMVEKGEISAGHARTLLSFKSEEEMRLAAERAKAGVSVRILEKMAKGVDQGGRLVVKVSPQEEVPRSMGPSQFYAETQLAVSDFLGRRVKVAGTKKKGTLQIEFYGEEDLQNLLKDLKLQDKES